jgi:hypothetical protein
MLSLVGAVLKSLNNNVRTNDYINESNLNRKLTQDIYEPVREKQRWIYGKGKEKQMKINQKSWENKIRRILQCHFKYEFKKVRPKWLRNELTKRNLELDMFCEELKLSCEYNGGQHTQYIPFFHKRGEKDFHDQLVRDHLKWTKCKEKGIKLVVVNHFEITDEMLDSEILELLLQKIAKVF